MAYRSVMNSFELCKLPMKFLAIEREQGGALCLVSRLVNENYAIAKIILRLNFSSP